VSLRTTFPLLGRGGGVVALAVVPTTLVWGRREALANLKTYRYICRSHFPVFSDKTGA
jgi:hypothetical protein